MNVLNIVYKILNNIFFSFDKQEQASELILRFQFEKDKQKLPGDPSIMLMQC